jgi:hypothetical protein
VWVFGDVLVREFRDGIREPAWIAADIALAFTLQAAAGLLLTWVLRRALSLRSLAVLVALPAFTVGLNLLYLGVIPVHF